MVVRKGPHAVFFCAFYTANIYDHITIKLQSFVVSQFPSTIIGSALPLVVLITVWMAVEIMILDLKVKITTIGCNLHYLSDCNFYF